MSFLRFRRKFAQSFIGPTTASTRLIISPISVTGTSGGGSGTGTYNNRTPTTIVSNITQLKAALAAATPGTIIGVTAGIYTDNQSAYSSRQIPAFRPGQSGTASQPIIIVGENDPTAMTNPLTDATRTEFRSGSGAYNGSNSHPCIGSLNHNYVFWENIVLNEDNIITHSDNGPVYIANCTGSGIERCVVHGSASAGLWGDNHNCVRFGDANNVTISPFVKGCILDNINTPTNSNAAGIMTYGARDFLIEDTTIYNCRSSVYIKGGDDLGFFNYGTFRRCWIENYQFFRLQEHQGGDIVLSQCLFKGFSNSGVIITDFAQPRHNNVKVRNCTFIADVAVENGQIMVEYPSPSGLDIEDSIFYATGSNRIAVNADAMTSAFGTLDNNQYFNTAGFTNYWHKNGTGYSSHATWAAAVGETNSVATNPGFVNAAASNFRLTTPNGRGCYITGTETIGAGDRGNP